MTVPEKRLIDVDSQSTYYWIDPKKRKVKEFNFPSLVSNEPEHSIKKRYELFESNWNTLQSKIEEILDEFKKTQIREILEVVNLPSSHKLDIVIVENFLVKEQHLQQYAHSLDRKNSEGKKTRYVVCDIDSKCSSINRAITSIVQNVVYSENSNSFNNDVEYDEDEDDDELKLRKSMMYDLSFIQEWYESRSADGENWKILVFLKDTDLFDSELLNNLLLLLTQCSGIELKVIMTVSSILNLDSKLYPKTKRVIQSSIVECDSKTSVIEKMFKLVLSQSDGIVLGFESVRFLWDAIRNSGLGTRFVEILKYFYMGFYFSNVLSVFSGFHTEDEINTQMILPYLDIFRVLPSFKRHIELLIEHIKSTTITTSDTEEQILVRNTKETILKLLNDDMSLISLIKNSINECKQSLARLYRSIDLITFLEHLTGSTTSEVETYINVASGNFFSGLYFDQLLINVSNLPIEKITSLIEHIKSSTDYSHFSKLLQDEKFKNKLKLSTGRNCNGIQQKLASRYVSNEIVKSLKQDLICGPLEKKLFHEIFICDPSAVQVLKKICVPNIKSTVFEASIFWDDYLKSSSKPKLEAQSKDLQIEGTEPIISTLIKLYREGSVNINIYDYYSVFTNSLNKEDIIARLKEKVSNDPERRILEDCLVNEESWNKVCLSWFLLGIGEISLMGFTKDRRDFLEKRYWRGV